MALESGDAGPRTPITWGEGMRFRAIAMVAAVLFLICGCTSSEGEQRSSTGSGLAAKPELTVATGTSSSIRTTPTITAQPESTAQKRSSGGGSVSSAGDDSDPSTSFDDSDLKTFAGTQREYIYAYAACIRGKGVPVDIAEDGTMTYPGLPADQNTTLEQVQQQCLVEVGVIQTKNFTDRQLKTYYDLQREQWKCLSDNGFSVAPAQTFETYRDKAQQTGAPDWNVFSGVPESEVGAGLSKCPKKIAG